MYRQLAVRSLSTTKNWRDNGLVRAGGTVFPVSLFVDGVPISRKESVITYYLSIPGDRKRIPLAVIKKGDLCGLKCGCPCRGWCSLSALERALAASFRVASEGKHPSMHLDGRPFDLLNDRRREQLAGQEWGYSVALIEVRADWSQYSTGFGFAYPNQEQPCWACTTRRARMFDNLPTAPCRSHEMFSAEAGALMSPAGPFDWL